MTKSELVSKISDKTGIPRVDVLITIETMVKEIKESLLDGRNITIRNFGTIITKKRAAKIGRNIKKNVAMEIPEHYIVSFKASKELAAEIKSSSDSIKELKMKHKTDD